MDGTHLIRLRWRLTGAWLWPSFLVLTVVDALIVRALPFSGDGNSFVLAIIESAGLMFLAIAFVAPVVGFGLRRIRRDLPRAVARNYAGTFLVLGVSVGLLAAGVVHHSVVTGDRSAMLDASHRAEAWIGDHAPARFQTDLQEMSTVQIQPPDIYRSCVTDTTGTRDYCVVVDRTRPFGSGVRYSGTESNALLEQGGF